MLLVPYSLVFVCVCCFTQVLSQLAKAKTALEEISSKTDKLQRNNEMLAAENKKRLEKYVVHDIGRRYVFIPSEVCYRGLQNGLGFRFPFAGEMQFPFSVVDRHPDVRQTHQDRGLTYGPLLGILRDAVFYCLF